LNLADRTKLPLILLAKGKTARCHQQFGEGPESDRLIWLSHHVNISTVQLVFIMYQFDIYDTNEVYRTADALNSHLS
jgi:hypothetical protein